MWNIKLNKRESTHIILLTKLINIVNIDFNNKNIQNILPVTINGNISPTKVLYDFCLENFKLFTICVCD